MTNSTIYHTDGLPVVKNKDGSVNWFHTRALRADTTLDEPNTPPPVPSERFTGERNPAVSEDYSPDARDVYSGGTRARIPFERREQGDTEPTVDDINAQLAQGDSDG